MASRTSRSVAFSGSYAEESAIDDEPAVIKNEDDEEYECDKKPRALDDSKSRKRKSCTPSTSSAKPSKARIVSPPVDSDTMAAKDTPVVNTKTSKKTKKASKKASKTNKKAKKEPKRNSSTKSRVPPSADTKVLYLFDKESLPTENEWWNESYVEWTSSATEEIKEILKQDMICGALSGAEKAAADFAMDVKRNTNWITFGNGRTTTSNGGNSLGNIYDYRQDFPSMEPIVREQQVRLWNLSRIRVMNVPKTRPA